MERGRIQALPKFFGYPLLSQEGVKIDFKFCGYIYRANPNESPLKILEKGERGRNQGVPKNFRAPMYIAHCAVIVAIAQLSCSHFVSVVTLIDLLCNKLSFVSLLSVRLFCVEMLFSLC